MSRHLFRPLSFPLILHTREPSFPFFFNVARLEQVLFVPRDVYRQPPTPVIHTALDYKLISSVHSSHRDTVSLSAGRLHLVNHNMIFMLASMFSSLSHHQSNSVVSGYRQKQAATRWKHAARLNNIPKKDFCLLIGEWLFAVPRTLCMWVFHH